MKLSYWTKIHLLIENGFIRKMLSQICVKIKAKGGQHSSKGVSYFWFGSVFDLRFLSDQLGTNTGPLKCTVVFRTLPAGL